jgi:hypothetical protein
MIRLNDPTVILGELNEQFVVSAVEGQRYVSFGMEDNGTAVAAAFSIEGAERILAAVQAALDYAKEQDGE